MERHLWGVDWQPKKWKFYRLYAAFYVNERSSVVVSPNWADSCHVSNMQLDNMIKIIFMFPFLLSLWNFEGYKSIVLQCMSMFWPINKTIKRVKRSFFHDAAPYATVVLNSRIVISNNNFFTSWYIDINRWIQIL